MTFLSHLVTRFGRHASGALCLHAGKCCLWQLTHHQGTRSRHHDVLMEAMTEEDQRRLGSGGQRQDKLAEAS